MDGEDLLAYLIVGCVGLGLLWALWAAFISEFPNAGVWRRRRQLFLQQAEALGYEIDSEACTATKRVGDFSLLVGIATTYGKSKSIKLYGKFTLPDCPPKLGISQESLGAVSRAFGDKDLTLGEPEFDAVFWLTCDSTDQLRDYLTPTRSRAFLQQMVSIPRTCVRDGAVHTDVHFATPNRMGSYFSPVLEGLERLARALQGEDLPSGTQGAPTAVQQKLRKFGRNGALAWSLLALPTLAAIAQSDTGNAIDFLLAMVPVLMCTLHLSLLRGHPGTRLLLQGLYAFLALLAGGVLVLGLMDAADMAPFSLVKLREDEVVPFLMVGTLSTFWFWSCRHYLKALDTFTARSRGAALKTPR